MPIVQTDNATDITNTSAKLWGNLTNNGEEYFSVWFEWDDYTLNEDEGCAGFIATGNVCKDNRSILWKNRHSSSVDNKPFYDQGTNYSFFYITRDGYRNYSYMGINEVGLSIVNFAVSQNNLSQSNATNQTIAGTMSPGEIQKSILGNFSTVKDAAEFTALHCNGGSNGTQFAIISSEEGVGAIVAVDTPNPQHANPAYNITYINNTYAALANSFYCDGIPDNDNDDVTVKRILDDIVDNTTSSDGTNLINWHDACQRCGKNISGGVPLSGTFDTSNEITRSDCPSGFVGISGNDSYNMSNHMAWIAMGRQPLVGIWLPLGASYLTSQNDIPYNFTNNNGIEDYVDVKVNYATDGTGQGTNIYNGSRVHEIWAYTNHVENMTFDEYDILMDTISTCADEEEVKTRLKEFADKILSGYIENIPTRCWTI
jgi:hypothetical protein